MPSYETDERGGGGTKGLRKEKKPSFPCLLGYAKFCRVEFGKGQDD